MVGGGIGARVTAPNCFLVINLYHACNFFDAFHIYYEEGAEEITVLKTNLAHKETKISRVEYNLATAPTAKVQEICMQQLDKLEQEKAEIQRELRDKDNSLLNLFPKMSSSLHMV